MKVKTHRAIAAARAWADMTQEEFAERLTQATGKPWSRGMVNHLESGRRRIEFETVMAIARLTDVPLEFFEHGPVATGDDSAIPGQLNWLDEALVGAAA